MFFISCIQVFWVVKEFLLEKNYLKKKHMIDDIKGDFFNQLKQSFKNIFSHLRENLKESNGPHLFYPCPTTAGSLSLLTLQIPNQPLSVLVTMTWLLCFTTAVTMAGYSSEMNGLPFLCVFLHLLFPVSLRLGPA